PASRAAAAMRSTFPERSPTVGLICASAMRTLNLLYLRQILARSAAKTQNLLGVKRYPAFPAPNIMRILASVLPILAPLALAQVTPSISNVVNAGSNDARFCAGLLVTITGNNFGNVAGVVSVIAASQT